MTDDALLIKRAQSGETEAFRQLVERSKVNVYRLAYDLTGNRHDAEDLSQDVFVKAYRSLHSFRGDAKWSTWLYRITVNTCHDHRETVSHKIMKAREDIHEHEEVSANHNAGGYVSPDRTAESRLIQDSIEKALSTLSQRERAVFTLRHYHDLPLKEIASTLELTEGSVKSYLFRALQRLQQELAFYKKDLGLENPS